MPSDLEETIENAAADARNLLGQLGPLLWALHETHVSVVPRAILLSVDADAFVQIAVPDPDGVTRKGVVADLESLRRGISFEEAPRLFKSAGLREALNRSIVVYAVAALEGFLDKAGKPLWKRWRSDRTQNWPPDTLDRIALLDGLDQHAPGLSLSEHYVGVGWLVLVRNAIIHADGKASSKTRDDTKEHRLGPRWRHAAGSLVWDNCSSRQLTGDKWNGVPFSVAIDCFILPRLRGAQAFVFDATERLVEATRAPA